MRKTFVIAAVTAAMGIIPAAMAQNSQPLDVTPTNIAVRLGVVLPLDSALQNVGNPLIGFGAEYQFDRPLLAGGDTYFSVDYFTKDLKFGKGSVWPICLNQRFYSKARNFGRRTYAFIGAGIAIIDTDSSNTVLAARGGFGAELGDAIFFEAAGVISDRGSTARADSVGFYIGYRF